MRVWPGRTVRRPGMPRWTVAALPQVIAADYTAGETDYLLTIVARDVAELQQVLSRLTARGAGVVTYLFISA